MLYYTEIMGAVFSQSANVLSPLTQAYLKDVQISMFSLPLLAPLLLELHRV
jgi:hypothetical protein